MINPQNKLQKMPSFGGICPFPAKECAFLQINSCKKNSVSSKRCFRKRRRQQPECVRNASKMRQKCVRMGLVLLGKEERPKCVNIASKMRQKCAEHLWGRTPFGRYRKMRLPGTQRNSLVIHCRFPHRIVWANVWKQQLFKMARLQSEFCTKDFFRATIFLTKNAPKFSPKCLSLCSVGQKKSPENSLQISH